MADADEEEGFALLHRPLLHANAQLISSQKEEEEEEEEEKCLDCWGRSVSSSSTVPLGGWTVAFFFLGEFFFLKTLILLCFSYSFKILFLLHLFFQFDRFGVSLSCN